MNRIVAALALALSLVGTSAVALADTGAPAQAREHRGERAQFPMPAAQFQQRINERESKAREHMEKRLADRKVPADKANEVRAKFNAREARVNEKVAQVVADGTVTMPEAKEVRQVAQQGRPQHKKGDKKAPRQQGQR